MNQVPVTLYAVFSLHHWSFFCYHNLFLKYNNSFLYKQHFLYNNSFCYHKLSQSARIISKLHFVNFETLKTLYHSFVKSYLG